MFKYVFRAQVMTVGLAKPDVKPVGMLATAIFAPGHKAYDVTDIISGYQRVLSITRWQ